MILFLTNHWVFLQYLQQNSNELFYSLVEVENQQGQLTTIGNLFNRIFDQKVFLL